MKVRNSIYRIVFCLIFFPFLIFSVLITNIYFDRLEKVIMESLQVVADAQTEEMENFCEQQKNYLTFLGSTDIAKISIQKGLDQEADQYLNNMLYSQQEAVECINSLTLIDTNGKILACSQEHGPFASQGIQPLIASMGDASFFISDVLYKKDQTKTLVAVNKLEDDGRLIGYLFAEISMDFYENVRQRAELWSDSTFYLLDGESQIISAGTPMEGREAFVTSDEEREDYNQTYASIDFEKNPKGNFRYNLNGKHYITYYSNIAYTNWQFLLSVNMDNYQTQRTVYMILVCFLVLLCIAFAIWIGTFTSSRIVDPIRQISDTLKAVQKNQDYSLRIPVNRKDELGSLSQEVNELINFIETENLYQKQQQRLLQEKAEQDALTKVLNKERIDLFLSQALDRHLADCSLLAVLFVDVDDFKHFNTQYGHNVGDQVLLFLTSILRSITCGTVGRVGGDEFLVILEDPDLIQNLDNCLSQVKETAESAFHVRGSGTHLPVSCSIGAVRIDFSKKATGDFTMEHLAVLADQAMYDAKNQGKHRHVILDL